MLGVHRCNMVILIRIMDYITHHLHDMRLNPYTYPGWWFETCFPDIGNHSSNWFSYFFLEGFKPPTSIHHLTISLLICHVYPYIYIYVPYLFQLYMPYGQYPFISMVFHITQHIPASFFLDFEPARLPGTLPVHLEVVPRSADHVT